MNTKLTITLTAKLSKSYGENGFDFKVLFTNNINDEFVAYDDYCSLMYRNGYGKRMLENLTANLNNNKDLMDKLSEYTNWDDFLSDIQQTTDISAIVEEEVKSAIRNYWV